MRLSTTLFTGWKSRSFVVAMIAAAFFGLSARFGISQSNDDFSRSPLAKGSRLFSYQEETTTPKRSYKRQEVQLPENEFVPQRSEAPAKPAPKKPFVPKDPNSVTFDEFVQMFDGSEIPEETEKPEESTPHPLIEVDPEFVAFAKSEQEKTAAQHPLGDDEPSIDEETVSLERVADTAVEVEQPIQPTLSVQDEIEAPTPEIEMAAEPVLVPNSEAFDFPAENEVADLPEVIIEPNENTPADAETSSDEFHADGNPFASFDFGVAAVTAEGADSAPDIQAPSLGPVETTIVREELPESHAQPSEDSKEHVQPVAITPGIGNSQTSPTDGSPILITNMHSDVPRPTYPGQSSSKPVVQSAEKTDVVEATHAQPVRHSSVPRTFTASYTSNRPLSLSGRQSRLPLSSPAREPNRSSTLPTREVQTVITQKTALPLLPEVEVQDERPVLRFDDMNRASSEEEGPTLSPEATSFLPPDLYTPAKNKLRDEEIGYPVLVAQADTKSEQAAPAPSPATPPTVPPRADAFPEDLTPGDEVYVAKNTSLEISPSLFVGAIIGIVVLMLLYHRR